MKHRFLGVCGIQPFTNGNTNVLKGFFPGPALRMTTLETQDN